MQDLRLKDCLQHRKVYNILPKPPPDLLSKSKRLGLRKSLITGDNKLSPKAIFLNPKFFPTKLGSRKQLNYKRLK